jgi:TPP-dependent indolepyruvate ferredoxin oxidoreductase alpha subunit
MPMLYPSSVHEFLEMGLLGIAMSRYSGCWVGFKVISETVEIDGLGRRSGARARGSSCCRRISSCRPAG